MLIPARRRPASARRVRALLIGATLVSVLVLPAAALPGGPGSGAMSAAAAAPRAAVPFTVAPIPTITGKPVVGAQLIAVPGAWKPVGARLAYQWSSGDQVIARATSSRYTVTAQDAGRTITVKVTATRTGNVSAAKTSAPTAPVTRPAFRTVTVPTITGTATVGAALTAKPGAWSPAASFSYIWSRDDVRIPGATAATYRLTKADAGTRITVTVTGTKTGYDAQSRTSAAKTVPAAATPGPKPTPAPTTAPQPTPAPTSPAPTPKPTPTTAPLPSPTPTIPVPAPVPTPVTSAPTISGALLVGGTIRASTGTWSPAPDSFIYTWHLDNVKHRTQTSPDLVLDRAALGKKVTVTATPVFGGRPGATPRSSSTPTSAVAWPQVGVADGFGYDVVAVIGQSNAQGGGEGYHPDIDTTRDGLDQLAGNGPAKGKIIPAADTLVHYTTWGGGEGHYVGPGMEFGRRLLDASPADRRVLLVPAAEGGTSLTRTDAQTYTWDPSPDRGSVEAGLINLYANARTQIDTALASDPDNRLVAIIWGQGESDAYSILTASTPAEKAAAKDKYAARLLELETGLTTRYGKVPFLVGGMVPEWVGTRPERLEIQAVQVALPGLRAEAVYVPGVEGHHNGGDDVIHYDAAGARAMGAGYYKAFTAASRR